MKKTILPLLALGLALCCAGCLSVRTCSNFEEGDLGPQRRLLLDVSTLTVHVLEPLDSDPRSGRGVPVAGSRFLPEGFARKLAERLEVAGVGVRTRVRSGLELADDDVAATATGDGIDGVLVVEQLATDPNLHGPFVARELAFMATLLDPRTGAARWKAAFGVEQRGIAPASYDLLLEKAAAALVERMGSDGLLPESSGT